MPAVKHQAQQLAELQRQTLSVLLPNRPLVDSILKRSTREPGGDNRPLLESNRRTTGNCAPVGHRGSSGFLESLPHDERLALWRLVDNNKARETTVEGSENIWESLIAEMSNRDIFHAISFLEVDE